MVFKCALHKCFYKAVIIKRYIKKKTIKSRIKMYLKLIKTNKNE